MKKYYIRYSKDAIEDIKEIKKSGNKNAYNKNCCTDKRVRTTSKNRYRKARAIKRL